jgi:hypothetical protein
LKLYEIDQAIESLINQETGEISDFEAFTNLQMERNAKVENIALWIKNLNAESAAVKAEKDRMAERETALKNKAESLTNYLKLLLNGEKFSTAKVDVSYRKSTALEVDEGFIEWAMKRAKKYLKFKDPEIDKTAVKDAIKSGIELSKARIVDKQNIQIK